MEEWWPQLKHTAESLAYLIYIGFPIRFTKSKYIFAIFNYTINNFKSSNKITSYSSFTIRERSHMTSAAEGGGGFEMLTVADKGGGGGGGGLSLADVSKNT